MLQKVLIDLFSNRGAVWVLLGFSLILSIASVSANFADLKSEMGGEKEKKKCANKNAADENKKKRRTQSDKKTSNGAELSNSKTSDDEAGYSQQSYVQTIDHQAASDTSMSEKQDAVILPRESFERLICENIRLRRELMEVSNKEASNKETPNLEDIEELLKVQKIIQNRSESDKDKWIRLQMLVDYDIHDIHDINETITKCEKFLMSVEGMKKSQKTG